MELRSRGAMLSGGSGHFDDQRDQAGDNYLQLRGLVRFGVAHDAEREQRQGGHRESYSSAMALRPLQFHVTRNEASLTGTDVDGTETAGTSTAGCVIDFAQKWGIGSVMYPAEQHYDSGAEDQHYCFSFDYYYVVGTGR
jgi:hypothetical protein